MNARNRLVPGFLLSLLLFSHTLTLQQKVLGSQVVPEETDLPKNLWKYQNAIAQREKKICIRSFCIDKGQLTENFLAKQIREITEKNAPVTVSSNNRYPLVSSLPGEPFRPSVLDLQGASPTQVISAGDYIIPVKVYYLQKVASSPNGHRYSLGKYGGSRKEVLAALNQAAASSKDVSDKDMQNLSWAIQAGAAYKDLPVQMQVLVDKLIPQYRSVLKAEWWDEIENLWNKSSQALHLSSLQQFLTKNLGDTGRNLLAVKQVRERLTGRGGNSQNLSDIFLLKDGTPGTGNVLETQWSQLSDGVYARFVTPGNADDTGLLMLRIAEKKVNAKTQTNAQTKGFPLLQLISNALTVYELYQLITTLVALPEGNQNVQPLTMSPDLFGVTKELVDFGIKVCERRGTPKGRLSKAINIMCSVANGTPQIVKPKIK
ncbi:MAG: hypothetical protein SAK29_06605 [Scytonema sp. PMC 1069.18]|nr:hypothetical protein [Scytonema sp. PMC 1069.18]MEC4882086.1 hypothetical protein [Scytonema sp. PMC 1070.18]